jgi:hypothetical protein
MNARNQRATQSKSKSNCGRINKKKLEGHKSVPFNLPLRAVSLREESSFGTHRKAENDERQSRKESQSWKASNGYG